MNRSNSFYGYLTWAVGWTGAIMIPHYPIGGFAFALGGYAILLFTSKDA